MGYYGKKERKTKEEGEQHHEQQIHTELTPITAGSFTQKTMTSSMPASIRKKINQKKGLVSERLERVVANKLFRSCILQLTFESVCRFQVAWNLTVGSGRSESSW